MNIVIVGGGIAGLGCAWALARVGHAVTVFEKNATIGGHSHTVDVAFADATVAVDTGFIVYNEKTYPNLTALFNHLGVETRLSCMSFAFSHDDGMFEYGSRTLSEVFGQRRNLINPAFYRLLYDILKFYRVLPQRRHAPDLPTPMPTLGEYLRDNGFSSQFIHQHILPMAAAVWSMPIKQSAGFPVETFAQFFENHGLLQVRNRPAWRTVTGGSRQYIKKILADAPSLTVRVNTPVLGIRHTGGRPGLLLAGQTVDADAVVLACHADQALALLDAPGERERQILGAFSYTANAAVLHGDPRLMPRRRHIWSSWNYLSSSDETPCSLTYWMNRLQSLPDQYPLFVTLNPAFAPERVYGRYIYHHPVYTGESVKAQSRLQEIQGRGGIWYCGSYHGYGFHEDALVSGLRAARTLGASVPW